MWFERKGKSKGVTVQHKRKIEQSLPFVSSVVVGVRRPPNKCPPKFGRGRAPAPARLRAPGSPAPPPPRGPASRVTLFLGSSPSLADREIYGARREGGPSGLGLDVRAGRSRPRTTSGPGSPSTTAVRRSDGRRGGARGGGGSRPTPPRRRGRPPSFAPHLSLTGGGSS